MFVQGILSISKRRSPEDVGGCRNVRKVARERILKRSVPVERKTMFRRLTPHPWLIFFHLRVLRYHPWNTVDGRNSASQLGCIDLVNNGINYLSAGAGFLPSTVGICRNPESPVFWTHELQVVCISHVIFLAPSTFKGTTLSSEYYLKDPPEIVLGVVLGIIQSW